MSENKTKYLIDGSKSKWEVVIGLEVHAQVLSKSKLFTLGILIIFIKSKISGSVFISYFYLYKLD